MALETKSKNTELPGIEGDGVAPLSIPEIDKLAEKYVRERDKRQELTPKEVEAKENLIAAIHKHVDTGTLRKDENGVVTYRYEDQMITVKPGKESIKVKDVSESDEED